MSNFIDDRTEEQKKTHIYIVQGIDKFMSGWGEAKGKSYAGWACKKEHLSSVKRWVSGRTDMKCVNVQTGTWRPRLNRNDHCQIYVISDNHRAAKG